MVRIIGEGIEKDEINRRSGSWVVVELKRHSKRHGIDMERTCKNARLDDEEHEFNDDGVCCH